MSLGRLPPGGHLHARERHRERQRDRETERERQREPHAAEAPAIAVRVLQLVPAPDGIYMLHIDTQRRTDTERYTERGSTFILVGAGT